jgi:MFS family permease
LVAAAIVASIGLLYLLIKDRPDDLGLRPYGFGTKVDAKKKSANPDPRWPGFSFSEQLKRPAFYLMCVCVLASCTCIFMTSSFVIPHFRSIGFSAEEAATYQSVYMLTLAAAKLVIGFLYDRFGAKPVMLGCMFCAVAGQALLGLCTDPVLSLLGILLFAVGLCMSSIMIPLLTTPIFGYKAAMSVNGIFLGFSSFASLFSSPIASMCYDATGSYMPVYRVTALINVGITALFWLLLAMGKRERAKANR